MNVALAITIVGVLIFLAHFFVALFSRTRIPDALLLILIGVLLGPVLQLVHAEHLGKVGPVFAQITLAIMLFEGGLETRSKVIKENWKAGLSLIFPTFLVTALVTGYLVMKFTDLGFNRSMLLGAILGSTSPSVIISMIRHLKMASGPKVILILETAVTDVLCIILVLGFMEAHNAGGMRMSAMAAHIFVSFGLATLIGLACGLAWSMLLKKIRAIHNNIFLTLALVFILFGIMEFFHISGGVAVLCFGAAISNSDGIGLDRLGGGRFGRPAEFTDREKAFFSEVVFLLRTFFFVFLGLSLHFGDGHLILLAFALTAIGFLIRIPFVRFAMPRTMRKRDASLMSSMASKGLAAAVLATLPFQQGIEGGAIIRDLTYAIIPISIILNSALVFLIDKTPFGVFHGSFFKGFAKDSDEEGAESDFEKERMAPPIS
jgi:potassium/hydrogen antiporter